MEDKLQRCGYDPHEDLRWIPFPGELTAKNL